MKKTLDRLEGELQIAQQACAASSAKTIEEAIEKLPSGMQEAIRACFASSKTTNPRQRRYTSEWIYNCILFRIKSKTLYDHLRRMEILVLPCPDTLNNYLKNLQWEYGFQKSVFECLKLKAKEMLPACRRGNISIDEMKISENLHFDAATMTFKGFTDIGQHTPANRRESVGDHALVVMFQPFQGGWVQTLGCFLSNGCVSGEILHKLVIEAVAHVENAGFFVDAVTTDGASWNRAMWKKFGITENEPSCEHPMSDDRKLWFFSDFPHLIKTLPNWVTKTRIFMTPDGGVSLENWETVLKAEPPDSPATRLAHVLSWEHLNPSGFRKMNVPLAFQLFCPQVQAPRAVYAENSLPSRMFCKRVDDLITAIMSRTPAGAFRENSAHKQSITTFLTYLREWETSYPPLTCLSAPTLLGFKVTLQSTLELFEYLQKSHGYQYLMTCRLNQDVLERFFGIIRSACGCNEHPDARQFAQMYRFMSAYSLTKPPKNSNIAGGDILETLIGLENRPKLENSSWKSEWLEKLDAELNTIEYVDFNDNTMDHIMGSSACLSLLDHDYCIPNTEDEEMEVNDERPNPQETQPDLDHNYHISQTSDYVQSYITGYVARKMVGYFQCEACVQSLRSPHPQGRDKAIEFLSKGHLIYPNRRLFELKKAIEKIVFAEVSKNGIQYDTMLRISDQVLERISTSSEFPLVGCKEHCHVSTKQVISFYVVLRGHFLAKFFKRLNDITRQKTRNLRKSAKVN